MERWLETFPYRSDVGLALFILTGSVVVLASTAIVALSILKISRMKAVRLIADQ